jgi:hypothetical protein
MVVQVFVLTTLATLAGTLDPYLSTRALAMTLRERAQPLERIVGYGVSYENVLQTLPFYAGRRVMVLGPAGELELGAGHDPAAGDWFAPEETAQETLLRQSAGTWGVTDEEHWKTLSPAGGGNLFELIQREGRLILFQKVR